MLTGDEPAPEEVAMRWMARHFGHRQSRIARPILAVLVGSTMVVSVWSPVLAVPAFTAKAAVSPLIQYLNDATGTTFTLTIDNTGDVAIGAVEITRPTSAWTVIACPLAPPGWSTQRADPKCRYRSTDIALYNIPAHSMSSLFQVTATVAPGTQNITGTWTVVVSKTNQFDDKSKLKTAAPESPGLAITAYTFQILDAVVVGSVLTPGTACPAATAANHSAGTGTTQTIAICGRNRASIALTPAAPPSTLGGTFVTGGTFGSAPIAANSPSSVVLGNWSNATVNAPSGTGKSIIARIGSAANRTSPLSTLDDSCPTVQTADATCVNNGGYAAIDDAPFVTTTSPTNGASTVATDVNITVNFNESVDVTTSSFTIVCGSPKTFAVSGSGTTSITLDPAANLPEGTSCTVTAVANQISDSDLLDPPDHPTANASLSFTTDSAPTVTSRSPLAGAIGVAPGTNITVTFSEPVTASAGSFTIECPSGSGQPFAVTGSGTTAITLNPNADLPASTVCIVTVLATGMSDVDTGDPPDHLAANDVFSFTTLDGAPAVTTTSPADGADHVATDTNIVVNFNESVTATTSSFTIQCPTGTPKDFIVNGSPGSSITLDPTSNLPEGTICSVAVIASQIFDSDGIDPPDNPIANASFSFTTDSAPVVTTTIPAGTTIDVDPATNITINFSEPVDVTTSSFTIGCPTGTPEAFTMSGSGTSSITLDPIADLPGTVVCTVTAVAALISDSDVGDPPDHPAANMSFSFTTKDAAPSVASTIPGNGASGVAPTSTIAITFSESVTASASAFSLECPTGTAKTFTQSASPGVTITLTPDASLPQGSVCTVTVHKDEISDADAVDPPDIMAADYVFSFTVATDQAPTDIALTPSSVAENQPSGTTVGTFTTTDPDIGDTFTYSLVAGTGDTDNGSFAITGDTLATSASFDVETKASYSVRVRSTDSGSLFVEKQFTITVTDVNELPTDITLSNSSIDENQPSNTTIGSLTTTDPDTGQTHTLTLENGGCGGGPFLDNNSFTIPGSGPDLKSAVSFNFEVKSSYTICVRTTDSGVPTLSFDKQFTITINDVNDAPVANPDSYSGAIGNTLAVVQTTGSGPNVVLTGNVVKANDTDEDTTLPHTLTVVGEANTSTGGGTATIATDGSFTFLPGVGDKNQNDTFTYHVTDGTATSAGTVTVHIENFLVWYVDNASVSTTHDGRSSSPFLNLSSINAPGGSGDSDGADDYIFLYQGSGSYGGGIPLEATQKLFGEKHGLLVNGHQLVLAGATAPVITNASGTGVGLANGVDVQGLNISGTSGDGINGVGVTTATVGTTTAVNISSAGGDGVDLSGAASGNISIASPITGSAGHSVSVAGRGGGTTSFSGTISDTGTGISLSSNTGATINLTGGITASTGANAAFTATGGGTVNVTGSNNTLATTTGTALNVATTNVGSSGLTFRSISANGAASGIILNGTGAGGGLTVTGTGTAASGGTIQNTTGHGIALTSTTGPSFTDMSIQNTAGSGINGTQVTNFTFVDGTINNSGTGGAADDSNISFNDSSASANISGTLTVTGSALTNSRYHGVDVQNSTGTLSNVNVSGNTFTSSTSVLSSLGSAIRLVALGSSSSVANVTKASLNNNVISNFPSGAGFVVQGGNAADVLGPPAGTMGTAGSATNVIAITGNGMDGGLGGIGNQPDRFVTALVNGRGQGNFDISGNGTIANPITHIDGVVIELSEFGDGFVTATVSNNRIVANNAVGSSGIGIGCDADSLTTTSDVGSLISTISGNSVSLTDGPGIFAIARNSGCSSTTRIVNNTVAAPATTTAARAGIRVDSGSGVGDTTMCLEISGNVTAGSTNTGTATTSPGINLRKQGTSDSINVFGIEGLSPSPTGTPNVESWVNSQNTSTSGTFGVSGTALLSATSGFTSCIAP